MLTDEKYFQGKLEYIHAVRDAVKLPVLRKDFIIDPYQVYEIARRRRRRDPADRRVPAGERADRPADPRDGAEPDVLIEVHDMDNLIRVRDHVIGFPHRSYSLLGINNRDLRTFKTDLGTTLRMAELVEDRRVLVSESGIHTDADIAEARGGRRARGAGGREPDAQRRHRGEGARAVLRVNSPGTTHHGNLARR